MKSYSFAFSIPDSSPFDKQPSWFQTFVGAVVMPVCESGGLRRFWFTRYGAVGHGKTALFRVETDDIEIIEQLIQDLAASKGITFVKREDYDPHGDLGTGESSRFLGTDAKHHDNVRRGELAFNFLHAAAVLMLDCLVGPDENGYFALEAEKASGFSRESSFEQFHHLFCNMTCVPTYMVVANPPHSNDVIPITYEEYKQFSLQSGWRFGNCRRGDF